MKKKLKDLTITEIIEICDRTEFDECMFGECKINHLCGILKYDLTIPHLSKKDKEYLEKEIEL